MRHMILIFIAGCSYGVLSTFVKIAYGEGFEASEVIGAQNYSGWLILFTLVMIFSRQKVDLRSIFTLMIVGVNSGLTGIFYYESLKTIPASIAIVFLFQFVWIGIFIEAIADRRWPSKAKLLSIPFLIIGTLIAGGIFSGEQIELTLHGTILGLLSAITFAFFIFFSGRVATHLPALNRSLLMVSGAVILVTILYPPTFIVNGALSAGLWKYGIILGIFGYVIPPLFFAIGVPHVGPGLSSILSASELPMAVLMSAFVLHEPVSLLQWAGVILILIGIGIPQLLKEREIGHFTS